MIDALAKGIPNVNNLFKVLILCRCTIFFVGELKKNWIPKQIEKLRTDLLNLDFMDESVYNVQYSWTHQFYEEHNESSSKEKFFTVLLPKFLKKYPNFERDIVIERRNNDSKAIGIITSRYCIVQG